MSKDEIVEKKPKNIFEIMQKRHEEIWNRITKMDELFFNPDNWVKIKPPISINMGDISTFQSSMEKFQQQHPNAKIKASAYVYSTGTEPQVFKYETKETIPEVKEKPKLEKKSKVEEKKPKKKAKKK